MKRQQTLLNHFTSRATTSTSKDDNVAPARSQPQVNQDNLIENFDDDMFLAACQDWEEQALAHPRSEGSIDRTGQGLRVTQETVQQPSRPPGCQQPAPRATQLEDLPGFDVSAGNIWIYPTNYPVRDYQFNIVHRALFKNTMVTLPTGLGKTFVAAVVMYNFYRWYPEGKVIFMAPTKPLVAQQIEACYNVMGIPQTDMAEMTGNMPPVERKKAWQRCRVFFLTPQVLMNDLSRRACPTQQVKCLVVDEAHKALGNHAYCQVVRELFKYSSEFRVLALSATPGSDLKAVQQVLTNLLIAHIEIRSEESIDIQRYVHERKVEKVVVPLDDLMKSFRDQYLKILSVYIGRLNRCGALYNQDPATLTKFQILKSREAFRQDPPSRVKATGPVEGDYALSISLYHGFELLLQHGLRSLYNFLQSTIDGAKGFSRTRQELMRNGEFISLMDTLRDKFGEEEEGLNRSRLFSSPGSSRVKESKPYVTSHPKMARLQEIVLQHFRNLNTASDTDNPSTSKQQQQQQPTAKSTRVMIFAQYRDSVNEIAEMLNRHRPLLRCMGFVGQASSGKNTKGITQKEQLRVVKEFREGGYNTLVSTCVGEEGLDIGDVDLIVCYDAHKSPIRLVQRMGRTGRKRQGRIVMLVTEGKEAAVYDRSQYNKKGIHKALQGNAKSLQLYPNSPRMVPRGVDPQPHKMFISVQAFVNKKEGKRSSSSASRKSFAAGFDRLLFKAKREKKGGEFLSAEELAYWSANFKLDVAENASLPTMADNGHFLTLTKKKRQQSSKRKGSRSELSLTEWSPWQMNKQPIRFVQHSQRCNHFVEIMEFIDLQNLTEGEDIYGLEMQTYLDEEDVIKPKRRGIEQFCTTVSKDTDAENARSDNVGPKDEVSGSKKAGQQTAKKKRKPLELMSSPSNSDSDNLPDVFMEQEANATPKIPLGSLTEKHGMMSDPANQVTSETPKPRKHKQKLKHLKPKLDSSDDDDFAADSKQEKSPGDGQAVTSGHTMAHLEIDGKKVDAAEDKMKGSHKSRSPDLEYETPEPMDIDSDVPPMSPKFGKVSQSVPAASSSSQFKETDNDPLSLFPSFPDSLDSTLEDDHSISSGIRFGAGGKSSIPPPPPSLSSLDLLDDIDISVNLTQHFKKESNFFRSRKKQKDKFETSASVEDLVNDGDSRISNLSASAERMKDEASNSVLPHCDDSKNKLSSTGTFNNQKHNDCSTAKNADTETLAAIKPNFDLKMDFTIISDDEMETVEQPQSDKEGNTSNDSKKTSGQENEAKDKISMDINNQTGSIMNTPVAFDIETPQVESVLLETDSIQTQKTLPVSLVPSPHGCVQGGDASTRSQKGISSRPLPGGNKRTMPVFSETPKSRRDSVTKPRHAGQLIRDRPASTGVHQLGSKRELNLLEPQELNQSVSCDGKAQVFDDEDTAEIERMRLQVLGSSEPMFDLGFDLDSLEEDEIEEHGVVPPSPDMQQQQEYINMSQVAAQKEQPCSSQSRGMPSFWTRASSTPAQKTIKSSLGSLSCNDLVSPIAKYKQEKNNNVPDKSSKFFSVPQTEISAGEKSHPSIISDVPQSLGKQVQLPKTLDSRKSCHLRRGNSPATKNLSRTKERLSIGKRKSSPISTLSDGNPTGVKRRKSAPVTATSKFPPGTEEADVVVIALDAKDVELMEEFVSDGDDDKRVGLAPVPNVRPIRVTPNKLLDDSPDDDDNFSQVVQHKKRRKAVVLESPEQPAFKTPNKPSNSSHKKNRNITAVVSSSDDDLESPLIRRPKKRRQISKMLTGIDEDDEDFLDFDSGKKSVSEVKKKSCTDKRQNLRGGAQLTNTKQKKTKKPRPVPGEARDFFAEEVEVSTDEECSSDEEGSDLDNSLEGFINNATQASQASQSALEHSDMHAVYMQSVRSPHTGQIHPAQNRFKLVQRNSAHDDLKIFSQVPVQDESYYENSFVVRGDEEEDFEERVRKGRKGNEGDEDESLFENTINPDNIITSKRRGRHKGLSKAAQILKEGRRKALKTSSSSTSTEETEEELRRHDQRKPPTGIRRNLGRAATCPVTSPERNLGSSTQNTTGKSDKHASGLSAKSQVADHTQMSKTKMKKDSRNDYQNRSGDSPTETSPYNQSNFSTSHGSVIRQFIDCQRKTVNSCPSNFTIGKQSTQQRSPVKSNSVPLRIGDDCLTLAEKEKAERLKRQEEKKREFLRRMEERKKQQQLQISKELKLQVQHINQPKPLHGNLSNNAGQGNAQTQPPESQKPAERFPKNNIGTGATRPSVCQSSQQYSGIRKVEVIGGGVEAVLLQTTKMRSPVKAQPRSLSLSPSSIQMTSKTTLAGSQCEMSRGKPVILVDSKELSSSSHIVSTLALRHNLNPIVSQLSGCDYIVSTRMGVEKKSISDFGSSVNKNKLIDRVRHLCELFDRPCLIIEKDRVKVSDAKNPKPLIRTKYFDSTLATLSKTHVKVLYSDSLEDTARILADLVRIETRKGSALAPPPSMDSMQEQVLKFYASLPRVSYATAQSMMTAFPCVQQLINCSQEQLQLRAKISPARAKELLDFLRHRFDEQMTCLGAGR